MQTDSIGIAAGPTHHQYFYTFILVALLLVLHWATISFLYAFWWISPTYGHGLLILPIAAFLMWQKRHHLTSQPVNPSVLALALLVLAHLAWAAAYLTSIAVAQQLVLWAVIGLLLWSCLGWRAVKLLQFPLLLPLLALPLWDPVESLLQGLTATAVTHMLKVAQVPAYLEGHYIMIPEGRFSIENVCAGLRFFLALLTISCLFAYLNLRTVKCRVAFVAASVALAVVTNWVRVFAVIMAGHLTQMQHSLVHDHVSFGWWIFAFMLLPVFALGLYLQKKELGGRSDSEHGNQRYLNSSADELTSDSSRAPRWIPVVGSAAFVIVLVPLSVFYLQAHNPADSGTALVAPQARLAWSGPLTATGVWRPHFENADDTLLFSYQNGTQTVDLYAARYHRQQQNKELINYRNTLAAPKPWSGNGAGVLKDFTLADGERLPVVEVEIGGYGRSRLVWYWYDVGGTQTNRALVTKVLQIRENFQGYSGASVIAIATDVEESKQQADQRLRDFLLNHYPDIRSSLSVSQKPINPS